jgi:2-(1,2-epoxy-1,2-dihydrophenyl)acetyl-CoA isomerase
VGVLSFTAGALTCEAMEGDTAQMSRQQPPATVREAVPSDLQAIADCHTTCWQEAYAGLVPQSYLDDPEVIQRRLDKWRQRLSEGHPAYVAVLGDRVIGLARGGPSRDQPPPADLELRSLYVRASHQGTGVADRLLHSAIGNSAACLWVYEDNARANAFYSRHGFRADGTRKIDTETGVPEIRLVRPEQG